MKNENSKLQDDVLEILEGYSAATPEGNDFEVLKKWVQEHPAYAADLMSFAKSRDLAGYYDDAGFESSEEKAKYLSQAHELLTSYLASRPAPLPGIFARANELQIKKKDLAERLGVSAEMLVYLEQRSIEYTTIPRNFVNRLANTLESSIDSVAAFLRQDLRPSEAFYKNHDRPADSVKQDFVAVVDKDINLTAEQKKDLLSL